MAGLRIGGVQRADGKNRCLALEISLPCVLCALVAAYALKFYVYVSLVF